MIFTDRLRGHDSGILANGVQHLLSNHDQTWAVTREEDWESLMGSGLGIDTFTDRPIAPLNHQWSYCLHGMHPMRYSLREVEEASRRQQQTPDDHPEAGPSRSEPSNKRRNRASKGSSGIASSSKIQKVSTGQRARIGRRASLSMLVDMPLDVLFEIFGTLHPMDLLNVARTTKEFRALLMTRTSKSIWVQARTTNFPLLPDCPAGLSEPQYANLLFSHTCHFCTARVQRVIWEYNLRCCKSCFEQQFVTLDRFTSRELWVLDIKLGMMIPAVSRGPGLYYYVQEARKLVRDVELVSNDEEKLRALEAECIQRTKESQVKTEEMEQWHDLQLVGRTQEISQIRHKRRTDIIGKLAAYDLASEVDLMDEVQRETLMNQAWMKQAKPLTDRVWDNIRDQVLKYMNNFRDSRLSRERHSHIIGRVDLLKQVVLKHVRARPSPECIPGVPDFAMHPRIRAILEQPEGVVVTETSFTDLESFLPFVSLEWFHAVRDRLLNIMNISGHTNAAGLALLELATTWFFCTSCNKSLSFPRVLHHYCAQRQGGPLPEPTDAEGSLWNAIWWSTSQTPWNCHSELTHDRRNPPIAAHLVSLCDKDPLSTSAQAMDDLDPRFVCIRCTFNEKKMYKDFVSVSWRRAMEHLDSSHELNDFVLLSSLDTKGIKWHERGSPNWDLSLSPSWSCLICWEARLKTAIQIRKHCLVVHDIDWGAVQYLDPDADDTPACRPTFTTEVKNLGWEFTTPALATLKYL